MKPLADNSIFALTIPDNGFAFRRFNADEAKSLNAAVMQGKLSVLSIVNQDKSIARVFYTVNWRNDFHIDACESLVEVDVFALIYDGVKQMAKNLGCRGIVFQSIRAGMFKKIATINFKPVAITYYQSL